MIISGQQVQSALKLNRLQQVKKSYGVQSSSVVKSDQLTLSNTAQQLKFAKEQVLKSPDVRADKVNELKEQINKGNYQVSGVEIASKMISRSLVDELAGR